jgi:hypothetical protein
MKTDENKDLWIETKGIWGKEREGVSFNKPSLQVSTLLELFG